MDLRRNREDGDGIMVLHVVGDKDVSTIFASATTRRALIIEINTIGNLEYPLLSEIRRALLDHEKDDVR